MGSRSIAEGPYREQLSDNPEVTRELTQKLLTQENVRILVSEDDGKVCGVLCFLLFPHYFSGEMTAGELIWYMEPEYRHSWAAICLLRAAQRLAKEMGAKRMQFTAPTVEVGKAYESLGYKQVEITYQRSL